MEFKFSASDSFFLAYKYVEFNHHKKRVPECAVRLDDSSLVHAGLDAACDECVAVFFDLLYSGTDLSGTADNTGNSDKISDSVGMDCSSLPVWKPDLGKRQKEISGAGRLMRW